MKHLHLPPMLVLLVALGAVAPAPAAAGTIEPHFSDYLAGIPDGDFASAIVHLRDQADVQTLDVSLRQAHATRHSRNQTVVTALQEVAQRSQPPFLNHLQTRQSAGSVRGFTPYWISNLVVVWATKAELLALAQRADVDLIESNFRATLIEEVDQPYTGSPTLGIGITNSLKAINADRVWNELGITGAGTIVANLDTGVEGTHPALSARWRGNTEPASECWRDALGGGTTFPDDFNGHGTHTMGTMCGLSVATGDSVGVAPGALWIADNAIDQGVGSAFDNDVIDAFQWFANPDGNVNTTDDVPDVVQNSWGIDARFGGTYQDCDARWQTVILNCEAAGVVVTFSAGNEGPGAQTHRSPANIATTPTTNFAVGAVDAESFGFPYPIASFSSRGPSDCDGTSIKPEVSAPGVNVYSSYVGGGYARLSGTSMAGPHVAGVVALMRQANPNADVQTIKNALMNTSRDEGTAGEDNTYGRGVIDAYAAVQAVMGPDVTPPNVTVVAPNGGESLTAGGTFTILWNASDNVSVSQSALSYSTNGGTTFTPIVTLPGNPGSYAWTVPNTPTTQGLVRVVCTDPSGNTGSDNSNAFFTITNTPGPYIWVQNIALQLVTKGRNTNARATVTVLDQNGNPAGSATVSSAWSGLSSDTDVFNTAANGTGSCNSDKLRNPNGCWTYTVQNVSKPGFTFRNDLGVLTGIICTPAPPEGARALSALVAGAPADTHREFQLSVPAPAHVTLMIYNVMGRRVRTLADGNLPAGSQTLIWDLKDDRGLPLPSGVYLYRAVAGAEVVTRKVVLVR